MPSKIERGRASAKRRRDLLSAVRTRFSKRAETQRSSRPAADKTRPKRD